MNSAVWEMRNQEAEWEAGVSDANRWGASSGWDSISSEFKARVEFAVGVDPACERGTSSKNVVDPCWVPLTRD